MSRQLFKGYAASGRQIDRALFSLASLWLLHVGLGGLQSAGAAPDSTERHPGVQQPQAFDCDQDRAISE
jgi:hypothetical protein